MWRKVGTDFRDPVATSVEYWPATDELLAGFSYGPPYRVKGMVRLDVLLRGVLTYRKTTSQLKISDSLGCRVQK